MDAKEVVADVADVEPKKRGRGRPKKADQKPKAPKEIVPREPRLKRQAAQKSTKVIDEDSDGESPVVKKPKAKKSPQKSVNGKRGRGRPKKIVAQENDEVDEKSNEEESS